MKIINRLKFALLPALCLLGLASCFNGPDDRQIPEGSQDTRLAIRLPGMQDGMTRAIIGEFGDLRNIWIFIADGEDGSDLIRKRLYIDVEGGYTNPVAGDNDEGMVTFSSDDAGGTVIYSSKWLGSNDIISSESNFIIVANYSNGADISNVATVDELRSLRILGTNGWVNDNRRITYGESRVTGNTNKVVELSRAVSMITLEINGDDLYDDIEITPISASLHNVPNYATIGKPNILTTDAPGNTIPVLGGTEPIPGAISPTGRTIDTSSWGTLTNLNPSVGNHYEGGSGVYDYSDPNVVPLFMYENLHGENFGRPGVVNERDKRPNACASTAIDDINNYTKACSYLQVEARYSDTSTSTSKYGTVTYRVFLGADDLYNFDMVRNGYYRVTLNLSRYGIGEDGISWRLSTNLSTNIELSETDFIVNGGGREILIDAPGQDTGAGFYIYYNGNNQLQANPGGGTWVYYSTGGTNWATIDNINNTKLNLPGSFYIYIQPMIRDVTWFGQGNMRTVTFRLQQINSKVVTPDITITQWEPIAIPLSTYEGNAEIEARVASLGWSMTGTIYLDRVDGPGLPWGFEGEQIAAASVTTSGAQNGTFLMQNHGAAAGVYLPYGEGSAMMSAAFLKYYQRSGVPNGMSTSPDVDDILSYNTIPAGYPSNYFLPSRAQWELLNLMNKAVPIQFESGHAIPAFEPYWTSDAGTTPGSRQSYHFRIDGPVTAGGAFLSDRSTPLKYRMMYYMP